MSSFHLHVSFSAAEATLSHEHETRNDAITEAHELAEAGAHTWVYRHDHMAGRAFDGAPKYLYDNDVKWVPVAEFEPGGRQVR